MCSGEYGELAAGRVTIIKDSKSGADMTDQENPYHRSPRVHRHQIQLVHKV